jgi:hypothetical protein
MRIFKYGPLFYECNNGKAPNGFYYLLKDIPFFDNDISDMMGLCLVRNKNILLIRVLKEYGLYRDFLLYYAKIDRKQKSLLIADYEEFEAIRQELYKEFYSQALRESLPIERRKRCARKVYALRDFKKELKRINPHNLS